MFGGFNKLGVVRKWNLAMLAGVVGLLLAQRFYGQYVDLNAIFEKGITFFGAGLLIGVLVQARQKSKE